MDTLVVAGAVLGPISEGSGLSGCHGWLVWWITCLFLEREFYAGIVFEDQIL
jgi:hypothetical protein